MNFDIIPEKKQKKVIISFVTTKENKEILEKISKDKNCSISYAVNFILEHFLKEELEKK